MNILCITIDGLHAGMIGAMGNAWIQTPALDALACQSLVFDRYRADSLQLDAIFDALWNSGNRHGDDKNDGEQWTLPERFDQAGFRSILLTDDDDVFYHASAPFSEKHRLEWPTLDRPVGHGDETQIFQAFAAAIQLLETRRTQPVFLWTHLRAFRGVWDFPHEYREIYREEEDPVPYDEVSPPCATLSDGETYPDDIQAVMEAYAGGMTVLDDAIAGLWNWLKSGCFAENTLLILCSTRGFSLGAHNRIGPDKTLYGENIQLPLFIHVPFNSTSGFEPGRCNDLWTPSMLGNFLVGISDQQTEDGIFRTKIPQADQEMVLIAGDSERALLTKDWFLRCAEDRVELYAKPDDYWEINDVANRCGEVVEQLTPLLKQTDEH